jgi:hypothetical protein
MTPDRLILTTDPNGKPFAQPLELRPSHPYAITFCLLGGKDGTEPVVVISRSRPHLFVYNGLKACDPSAKPAQWKRTLEDYQAQVVSGRLTREVLETFQRISRENHGFPRYAVTSGRLWRHLKLEGQAALSVMAFWNPGLDQPGGPAPEVVKALKVVGPVYLVSSEKTQGAWHDLPPPEPA